MPGEIYELIARGARYWFLFLMVLIVWRSLRWYLKDRRNWKNRLKLLPDAGFIGELVVTGGEGAPEAGQTFSVPFEGTLGCSRTNDICLPSKELGRTHLWFRFEDGKGLRVEPLRGRTFAVDGRTWEKHGGPLYLLHGSRLSVGGTELRFRVFYGYDCPEAPDYPQGEPDQWAFAQAAWQQRMLEEAARQAQEQEEFPEPVGTPAEELPDLYLMDQDPNPDWSAYRRPPAGSVRPVPEADSRSGRGDVPEGDPVWDEPRAVFPKEPPGQPEPSPDRETGSGRGAPFEGGGGQ